MIADLCFGRPDRDGIRSAQFIGRASIPVGAACLVANSLREILREICGERCDVTIGEPAAIGPDAWHLLTADALCFLTCGRQTDIVLVVPNRCARTLVLRAFGEGEPAGSPCLSVLELEAVERIAARCAAAFDPLCAERRTPSRRVAANALPECVAYFDVRVAPLGIDIGVGIVRELPDPGPAPTFSPASLAHVSVDVRAHFATGTIDVATFLGLVPGDVIGLDSKVGAPAILKVGDRPIAIGTGGVHNSRYSFEVQTISRSMGAR